MPFRKECVSSWRFRLCPRFSQRAAGQAEGERKALQRGGPSVLDEEKWRTPTHNDDLRGARSWACDQSKGQWDHSQTWKTDYCSIPSAMKASETALSPGRAHDRRAGAPTGRITALQTKKQAEKKKRRRLRQVSYYSLCRQTPAASCPKKRMASGPSPLNYGIM